MQFQIELSRFGSFWGQPTVQFRVGLSRFGSFLGVWGRPCCADCAPLVPLEVPWVGMTRYYTSALAVSKGEVLRGRVLGIVERPGSWLEVCKSRDF